MKTKVLTLVTGILFLSLIVNAQIGEIGYAFQGYAVDAEGKALGNEDIKVRFTMLPGPFVEEHDLATDVFGVFAAIVGSKDPTTFKIINYSTIQSLKVEVKKIAGTYTTIHEGQMQSVPYAQYANNASNGVPVGTIIAFAGSTAPDGWLVCDGGAIPIAHTALATVLEEGVWGAGNLPDLRNKFLRGAHSGESRPVGTPEEYATAMPTLPFEGVAASGGEHSHSYQDTYHTVSGGSNLISGGSGPVATDDAVNNSGKEFQRETSAAGAHDHDVVISGGDAETRPENNAVLYIIKY